MTGKGAYLISEEILNKLVECPVEEDREVLAKKVLEDRLSVSHIGADYYYYYSDFRRDKEPDP